MQNISKHKLERQKPGLKRLGKLGLVLLGLGVFMFASSSGVKAESVSFESQIDWKNGFLTNTEAASKSGEVHLKPAGNWGARAWRSLDDSVSAGTAITSDGTYTYLLYNNQNRLVRYIPNEDKWQDLANAPRSAYRGADMFYSEHDGYIYAIFGGYQKEFARYSVALNTWEELSDAPELMYEGASINVVGNHVYVLRGTASSDFWRYDISAQQWESLESTPANTYRGPELVYYNGYFYTPRGYNRQTFYRYEVASDTWTTMSDIPEGVYDMHNCDIVDGNIYLNIGRSGTSFYKYDINADSWTQLSDTPLTHHSIGLVYNQSDGYIHFFRGGSRHFWKYDINNDEFIGPAAMPHYMGSGGDLVYYDGYFYAPRGRNSTDFWRYHIASNTWETLTSTPIEFNDDTKGAEAGGLIYFFRGAGMTEFYAYDPVADSWSTLAETPEIVRYGATLVYPGSGDYIYASRGQNTQQFWRYSISGNSWSDEDAPDPTGENWFSYGSRLVTDGTDIYYFSGRGTAELLKYEIGGDWTKISDLPYAPYWGTDVTYYNGKFYIQAGYYQKDFWEYDPGANSWRRLADMAGYYAYDQGPYNGGSLESDQNGTLYSTWGANIYKMQTFTVSEDDYLTSGEWQSDTIDLSYVSAFTSIASSSAVPENSWIQVQTRSATDAAHWSSWADATSGTVSSPAQRYLQVKFKMSGNGSQTPTLNSITVNYQGDQTPPTNPDTFTALSQEVGGEAISQSTTYNHRRPYFSWSGASDSETSVSGYYVYFGTDSEADPETQGSYQTTANYTTTEPLVSDSYYLRVKTKDSGGNVSEAVTGFVYIYQGIEESSLTISTSEEFAQAETITNLSTSSGRLKLSSREGLWLEKRISEAPGRIYQGGDSVYVASENKIFTLRGNNTTDFYEYDISSDTWTELADTPEGVYYGGAIIEGPSDYLYALRGNNTDTFWRYQISTNTWSDEGAVDAPQSVYYGGSAVYDGSQYIYAMRGNNDDAFFRYDTSVDLWETLTATDFGALSNQINNMVRHGGDLTFDGSDTIYAIQGNTRTGFAKYNTLDGEWTVLENLPFMAHSGAQIVYNAQEEAIFYLPANGQPYHFKYDLGSQTWTQLNDGPTSFYYGCSMNSAGDKIYISRGYNQENFYQYDPEADSWLTPTRNLFGDSFEGGTRHRFYYGTDIIKGSGNLFYIVRGDFANQFISYNAQNGETTNLADFPAGAYIGSSLEYVGDENRIYATTSMYNRKFYYYDIANDSWHEVESDPILQDSRYGASMAYDGERYLYWARGSNSNDVYRYDLDGEAGSRWEQIEDALSNIHYGSEMVFKDGYLYAMRGGNVNPNPLYRYQPGVGWTTLTSLDDAIYNDGFLVDGGGDYLFACRASNTSSCYRYSITNDSWEAIEDAPANIYRGGAAASDESEKIYVIAGNNGSNATYNDGIYTYVMNTENTAFEEEGSYISAVHDLGNNYDYANISLQYTSATNTSLTVFTRSSADSETFSSWAEVSKERSTGNTYKYKINSPAQRYLQVKFEIVSADGVYSPEIEEYTINYYQDSLIPSNPTDLGAYSTATQSASLTTNNWYFHESPQFDWPDAEATGGASDTATGSGVAGYWVYFGTDQDAEATVSGSLQTETEYTASEMTSGESYYLKIRTVDDAGNLALQDWQPFVYQFDNENPSNPQTLTADPPGYTASNSYDFAWSGATDSASGVAQYCYKTGEDDFDETCTLEASISGVLAYQTGTNTFYIRAKDEAGNMPSEYSTAPYYYNSTAPSPPQNLTVTASQPKDGDTTSSEVNEFAFSWDPPESYYGQQSGLLYYYSINSQPTANNVNEVGLTNTYLPASAYGTQEGENQFYVVAKDEAGNIDYTLYSTVTFSVDTAAPSIPRDIEIADVSVKSTESWKLAFSWDTPTSSGSSGIDHYKVYRTTIDDADCTSGFSDFSFLATTTVTSYVDTSLEQDYYYYCVKACDSINNCSAVSDTVNMYPDGRWTTAPDLTASPSATVKTKTASIAWSTNRTCNSFVKYGTSSGDFGEEVGSSTHVTSHEVDLEGLDPGTTYYYKAFWTDEDGNTGESDEYSLATNPAPVVSNVKASDVDLYSAYITFTIAHATQAKIQYGESLSYGGVETISTSKNEGTYTVKIDDLKDGTEYHFRIVGTDEEENEFVGDDYVFQTLPVPEVTSVRVQQVLGVPSATVRLIWSTNTDVSSIVSYYPTNAPSMARDKIDLVMTSTHEMIVTSLLDETEYQFVIKGQDVAGNQAEAEPITLKTATDVRPPEIQNLEVETSIIGAGEEAKAQIIVSWDTDEPGTTQVEYGEGTGDEYNKKTQKDSTLTANHVVTIPDVDPAKVYHLRALSDDKAQNQGFSYDTVVITPKATKSALNLVIENLSKTFGFLNRLSVPE